MQRSKIAEQWLLLALPALLMSIASGCVGVPSKPLLKERTPLAGCSERTAGLPLTPPPENDLPAEIPQGVKRDWQAEYRNLYAVAELLTLDWMEAYTGAARAYTSEVRLRSNSADCLDAHRAPPKSWWQRLIGSD